MDKLQPIIAQRFWILIGLVIPLSMYGYFSANSAIKAATAAKESELDSMINGIPSGNSPNEDYSKKLTFINENLEKMVDDVILDLWNKQKERMTWPVVMEGRVPHNFMQVEDPTFNVEAGHAFKSVYELELEELMKVVEPVYPLIEQDKIPKDTKQKVILIPDVPRIQLGRMSVKPQDIWDAQIDIWLTKLIFEAVRRTNEDSDTVSEAVLRRIEKFRLFGGTGEPLVAGGAGGGLAGGYESSGGGYEGDAGAMPGMGYEGGGGFGMTGAAGGGAAAIKSSVAFKPSDEFGSDADSSGSASAGGGYESSGGSGYESDGGMMGMFGGGATAGPKLRYIGETEEAPFLERGFYMSVIIQQSKIPDFLTELVSAPWPVRVTRFSLGDNPFRKKESLGSYGGGGMLGMMGGYPGAMGGGYGDMAYEGGGGYGAGYEGGGGLGMAGMMGGGGYGDFGYGMMGGEGGLTKSRFAGNLPPYATEALNSPELVQLDVCGVITMYKQPEADKQPVAGEGEAAPADDAAAETTPDASTMPAEGAGATDVPADGSVPAEGTPADGAPATESAAPASGEPGAEAPADSGTPAAAGASDALPAEPN